MRKNSKGIISMILVMIMLITMAEPMHANAVNGGISLYAGTEQEMLESDAAYVNELKVTEIVDGQAPFDANDSRGNDSNANNRIIRSYDTLRYELEYSVQMYNSAESYKNGYIWFEVVLPFTQNDAYFDTDVMNWMCTDKDHKWKITEKNGTQTLLCAKKLTPTKGNVTSLPGRGTVEFVMQIRGMKNNDKIQPTFSAFMDYNKATSKGAVCQTHKDKDNHGKEFVTTVPEEVVVTTIPGYNIAIQEIQDTAAYAGGDWNFSTGNNKALNKDKGTVNGRLVGFGVTVQMYNIDKNKGVKGIEYPEGPISFDINLSSSYLQDNNTSIPLDDREEYRPLVWSYGPSSNGDAIDGRDVSLIYGTTYLAAPYNSSGHSIAEDGALKSPERCDTCWNGGDWSMQQNGRTIRCTISNYEINPNWFPNYNVSSVEINPDYEKNEGCFSSGEIFVVVPYGQNDKYLGNVYGNGTIQLNLTDTNMSATSKTGDHVTQQGNNDDDKAAKVVHLSRPGDYVNKVYYAYYGSDDIGFWEDSNEPHMGDCYKNGQDASCIGSNVAISWGGVNNAQGEMDNFAEAGDFLMKFDDEALTVDTSKQMKSNMTGSNTFYFAVKQDGTGWANDDDMENAKINDLKYYPTLAEAQQNGVCVGLLWSWRCDHSEKNHANLNINNEDMFAKAWFNIKTDLSLTGKVYQIVPVANIWRARVLAREANGTVNTKDVVSQYHAQFGAPQPAKSLENVMHAYQKSEYDKSGYIGGHTALFGGWEYGDSLYLAGYESRINKAILQKDSSGEDKSVFDLDAGQKIVDYELAPYMDISERITWASPTTITIVDTLPNGIEYIDGSAVLGAEYEEGESGFTGTFKGGSPLEPKKGTVTKDGTVYNTLTWTINNATVQYKQPKIFYKGQILPTVESGQQLDNTVTISTTEDNRIHSSLNGNMDTVGCGVVKLSNVSVTKRSKQLLYDINDDISYAVSLSNNSNKVMENEILLDIMPLNGKNSSLYNGSYSIKELSVACDTPFEVYYTLDENVHGTKAIDYKYDEIIDGISGGVTWKMASVSGNKVSFGEDSDKVIAWTLIANIPAASMVTVENVIDTEGNKPEDIYYNTASVNKSEVAAPVSIVGRELSGTTWIDVNEDGKRDSNEKLLPGVTVTLYDESGNVVKDLKDGKECIAKTDANGNYLFLNLPAGEFKVVFSDGDVKLKDYTLTLPNAPNVDTTVNSDAVLTDKTPTISAIKMPKASEMTTPYYKVEHLDAGFYQFGKLKITKTVKNAQPGDESDCFDITVNFATPVGLVLSKVKDSTGRTYEITNGMLMLNMKANETIELVDIPAETVYTVTEKDYVLYNETIKYGNTANVKTITTGTDTVNVENLRVNRLLAGTTWIDANKDGKRDPKEKLLPGVTVTVYDNAGNIVKDLKYGKECIAKTDKEGNYLFENLPAGKLKVVFSDGDVVLNDYVLTLQNAKGVSKKVNSDAKATKKTPEISNIKMPKDEKIVNSPYKVLHQDAGFYNDKPVKVKPTPKPLPKKTPKTGYEGYGFVWIGLMIVSLFGLVITLRKKNNVKKTI